MSWPVTAQPRKETHFTVDDDAGGLTIFEKRVAAAVIAQAVKDYTAPEPTHELSWKRWAVPHHEAAAFLFSDHSSLEFWCDVAGWEVAWVRRRVRSRSTTSQDILRGVTR